MAGTMADIRYAFQKEFPKQTAGKSRDEVYKIMKEMGYGINTGLMKEFRKKKKMAYGGMTTKKTKMMGGGMGTKKKMGSTDYRSGGMVLSSSKNGKAV